MGARLRSTLNNVWKRPKAGTPQRPNSGFFRFLDKADPWQWRLIPTDFYPFFLFLDIVNIHINNVFVMREIVL